MSITFGFVGNRPDVGHLIAASEADRLTLKPSDAPSSSRNVEGSSWNSEVRSGERSVAWGVGFFQADEVLLRRRPADPRPQVSLAQEMGEVRAHALLAQMRLVPHGELTTESTPPLRFGHLLFASTPLVLSDPKAAAGPNLKSAVMARLPVFLHPTIGSGTLPELLLGLFLSALPHAQLERSRDVRAARGALGAELIRNAIKSTLETFDQILSEVGGSAFMGDIWVCSGEHLVIAHRAGMLAMRVFRSRRELAELAANQSAAAAIEISGSDLAYAVGVLGGSDQLGPGWERLPDQTLLTIGRSGPPETTTLLAPEAPSSSRPSSSKPER